MLSEHDNEHNGMLNAERWAQNEDIRRRYLLFAE